MGNPDNNEIVWFLLKSSISFFWRLDFSSTYIHKETIGIPIAKKMIIVRIGIRITNYADPKTMCFAKGYKPAIHKTIHKQILITTYLTYGASAYFSPSSSSVLSSSCEILFLLFRNFLTSSSISLNWSSDIFAILASHSIPFESRTSSVSLTTSSLWSINESEIICIWIQKRIFQVRILSMVKTYFITFLDLTYDVATTHNRNYANNENWLGLIDWNQLT